MFRLYATAGAAWSPIHGRIGEGRWVPQLPSGPPARLAAPASAAVISGESMSRTVGPRWIVGFSALIVAGGCFGLLGWMLWPK
jgi:hypothetical protein